MPIGCSLADKSKHLNVNVVLGFQNIIGLLIATLSKSL